MPVQGISPYITFTGQADEAIRFYQQALGARDVRIMRFTDMPGFNPPAERKDWVMHAHLRLGELTFAVHDTMDEVEIPAGGRVQIQLNYTDVDEMRAAFDALTVGGDVFCAIHLAFWGDYFGVVTDRFGVGWMFIAPGPVQGECPV